MFARHRQSLPLVEQWERVNRWLAKVQTAYGSSVTDADDMMDLFYALFQNIFAMRDWLLSSGIDESKVNALFASNRLQLCRDIANGTKHCKLTRPSVDADFLTLREYEPASRGSAHAFRLVADGQRIDMYTFAGLCLWEIQQFMISEGLNGAQSAIYCPAMAQGATP